IPADILASLTTCPAGCQRMLPLLLPQVNTMAHAALERRFPAEYARRLADAVAWQADVAFVRGLPAR
ncbi:unnamed protein product, partial [Phaeothamnion confervicola]